ncbi:MAG: PEP-CTERM system TPR-repeat protein PrsT, partial [Geobacteraceae bacterium]|nr:PEP-CTERM system TPR-repeat protein PrsT [Geobacteraceae bacterium]
MLALLIGTTGCVGKTSEELCTEGVKLLREGNPGGAIVLFKNALEKNQNYLEARYQLAKAYMSEKKYEAAEKEFQKVKLLNPNQPGINFDLAKLYNGLGKPDLAIRSAEQYLLEKPDSADALEVIGSAYRIKKMPQEAETFFQRALQIEPDKLTTKLELASVHAGLGNTDKAKALLEEIVRSAPTNIRAIYLLAAIETSLGRKVEALALYKKLGEINPADPVAPYKAGLLHFEMEHFAIAEAIAADLIKKFPSQAEGYRLKGIVFYHNKNFPEAITSLQHANKLQPSLSGYFSLGLSLYANGELESALNQFRQILDRAPSFQQARLLTGTILLQQKRVDDAISELTKLLESDDNNPLAHNMLGSAYIAKGMYEEGMRELETATTLDPKLIDAYLKKGMLHLSQGKTADVEVDLKTAIRV